MASPVRTGGALAAGAVVGALAIAGWTSPAFAGVRSGLTTASRGVLDLFRDNVPGFDGGPTGVAGDLAASAAIALGLVVLAIAFVRPARESTRGMVVTLLAGVAVFLALFSPTLVSQLSGGA